MSNLQLGTLKYICTHVVTIEDVRLFNMTTLGSLFVRQWVERTGNQLKATKAGYAAFELYKAPQPNYRQSEGEISDRVRTMMHISKLEALKKAS